MRLRKVKHAKEYIEDNPHIVIQTPKSLKGKWRDEFGNDNEIQIEIGCGKGKFITELAMNNPNTNYVGIEKFDSVIVRAIEKLIDTPLKNIRLIRMDAEHLQEVFSKGEIQTIYLNFSDPWPKNRQAKRRLTSPKFLSVYKKVLTDHSQVRFKTDNFGLFQYSMMTFNDDQSYVIDDVILDLYRNLPKDNVQTEFEMKFVEMGNLIHYLNVRYKGEQNEKNL